MFARHIPLEVAVAALDVAILMRWLALHQVSRWMCRNAFGHWVVGHFLTWSVVCAGW